MNKRYCFDTSALTNPLQTMPPDIHKSMWASIIGLIRGAIIAVTPEIYRELLRFDFPMASNFIADHEKELLLDFETSSWEWSSYVSHLASMLEKYHDYLSENQRFSRKTVCENDLTTIALAKFMNIPLVSMESKINPKAILKLHIPDVCEREHVEHLWLNDFLRKEKLSF